MKYKNLIITVLVIIILILAYSLFKNNSTTQQLYGENENLSVEAINQLKEEYIEVSKEVQAANFLDDYMTSEMEDAITVEEFVNEMDSLNAFTLLDNDSKCRIVKRWLRKQKCKPKRRIFKQIVNKTKIGSIGYEDGKIAVNAPQIARFRNEVNRINVLMESFYNLKSTNCDSSGFCYTNALLMACVQINGTNGDVLSDTHKRCAKLFTGELQANFVNVLRIFYSNIEKFNDGEVTEQQVKDVMDAELDKVEQEIIGAEEEKKEDDTENQNEAEDSNTESKEDTDSE